MTLCRTLSPASPLSCRKARTARSASGRGKPPPEADLRSPSSASFCSEVSGCTVMSARPGGKLAALVHLDLLAADRVKDRDGVIDDLDMPPGTPGDGLHCPPGVGLELGDLPQCLPQLSRVRGAPVMPADHPVPG